MITLQKVILLKIFQMQGARFLRNEAYPAYAAVSLADAWIAACSILEGAILVHKDPELEALGYEQFLLLYKVSG